VPKPAVLLKSMSLQLEMGADQYGRKSRQLQPAWKQRGTEAIGNGMKRELGSRQFRHKQEGNQKTTLLMGFRYSKDNSVSKEIINLAIMLWYRQQLEHNPKQANASEARITRMQAEQSDSQGKVISLQALNPAWLRSIFRPSWSLQL